jgi:hypothetical protein
MRLALGMGRTVAELRETMDAHEWSRWLLYHELYDLPDGFLVAGQLGALVSRVVGGKGNPEDFAPYFKVDPQQSLRPPCEPDARPAAGRNDLKPLYNFLSAYAKERAASGRPLPQSRRK